MSALLAAHAAATLFMAGLIWFVQVVHYPLLRAVGGDAAAAYARAHARRTSWVVAAPMLVEALTAVGLVVSRPPSVPALWAWCGLALVALIWISTGLLQVPEHALLALGFDDGAHRRLVRTNWIRTAAWSVRAALALALLMRTGG